MTGPRICNHPWTNFWMACSFVTELVSFSEAGKGEIQGSLRSGFASGRDDVSSGWERVFRVERGDVREAFGGDPAGDSVQVEGLGAALVGKALVEGGPVAGLFAVDDGQRQGNERVEQVVELVLVAQIGPDLFADGVDGRRIDQAGGVRQDAAESGGAGAALFEAGVVEEGVGVGVEQLVGEDRRVWECRPRGSGWFPARYRAEAR